MKEAVNDALRVYGEFLDGDQRMSTAAVDALRTIRQYVHELDPTNEVIQKTLVMAKTQGLSGAALKALVDEVRSRKKVVHHVLFWLKNPHSPEDLAALLSGLNTLRQIPAIREMHIGVPAATEQRDVIDSSYSVSELMLFDDVAGQNDYQNHPVHTQFVETCSHLWDRVVVYDSIDVEMA
jgi:hypothetical protein